MGTSQALTFEYSGAPQLSPEWFAARRGKVTASKLDKWLAVSKAKATEGKPLKARLDYEKELMFERQFNTNFEVYVNSAMQDGVDFEDFGRKQYELITAAKCEEVGCWSNDYFVASPDRKLVGVEAGIEVKILRDNSFTQVLVDGVPDKHWKQIQGQLWATGWKYVDYVAVNFNTKKVVITRVEPDQEFIDYLTEAVQEQLVQEEFSLTNVHDIVGELPAWSEAMSGPEKNDFTEGW